jgi:phosphocarrier protein
VIERRFIITSELGIHARPAGHLAKVASGFSCDILFGTTEKMVSAKHIMGILGLAVKPGSEVIITFDGEDEESAALQIMTFLREHL